MVVGTIKYEYVDGRYAAGSVVLKSSWNVPSGRTVAWLRAAVMAEGLGSTGVPLALMTDANGSRVMSL